MEFTDSLKLNYEFRRAYRKGRSAAEPCLVVYARRNGKAGNRLGFTVSNKLGCAVVRNRSKRVLREAARALRLPVEGCDVILFATPRTRTAHPEEMIEALKSLLKRAGVA